MSFRFRGRNSRRTWTPNARFGRRRAYSTGSSLAKRSRGNMRAANQQNDASSVVINLMHSVYAGCANAFEARAGGVNYDNHAIPAGEVKVGTVAVNIYDLLRKSDFFSSYSGMYDQFRINSIKVKVTPTQWSVFDQSRSAVNFSNYGDKNTAQYTTVVYTEPPDPTEYVINPDFDPQIPESEENLKKIVPGIPVEPGNYVPTPITDRWQVYRGNGINYVVNYYDANAGAEHYAGFGFIDGVIDSWTKQTLTNVPLRELGGDSTFVYPQALTVITAWDRTGLSPRQFNKLTDDNLGCFITNDTDGELTHYELNADHNWNLYCFNIGDTISSYSSSQTKQLVGGSNFNLVRYLYPNSQQEKSTYYSTSSLINQFIRDEDRSSHYIFRRDVGVTEDQLKPENLTHYLESPVVPFKPTLLIGVLGSNDVSSVGYDYGVQPNRGRSMKNTNLVKPVKFNLEFDIGVTFRGLRKTQVVSAEAIQDLKLVQLDTLDGAIINPDPPFQAMYQVEVLPVILADAVVGMGDCDRLGSFRIEDGNFVELEDGEMATAVYNLYEFTIDRYNEKQSLIDPNFVDKLGFKSIRFIMKNVGMSLLNDNITYNKRLLDDFVMTVDFSNNDIRANILGLDSPWAMYTSKQRSPGPVDITSNTITVDTVDTPNILDQDINYDSWPVQQTRTRDASSVDTYIPQDYEIIDGKIVRKQVGISGYDIDLDIHCLRSLTVTPTSFPYTFRIADYNSGYNTDYVGIRKLIVNGTNPLPTQTKSVTYTQNGTYSVVPDSGYTLSQVDVTVNASSTPSKIEITKFNYIGENIYTWDEFTQGNGTSVTIPGNSTYIYYTYDGLHFFLNVLSNNNNTTKTMTPSRSTYYKIINHGNQTASSIYLMDADDVIIMFFKDSDPTDGAGTRVVFNKNLFEFVNAL